MQAPLFTTWHPLPYPFDNSYVYNYNIYSCNQLCTSLKGHLDACHLQTDSKLLHRLGLGKPQTSWIIRSWQPWFHKFNNFKGTGIFLVQSNGVSLVEVKEGHITIRWTSVCEWVELKRDGLESVHLKCDTSQPTMGDAHILKNAPFLLLSS